MSEEEQGGPGPGAPPPAGDPALSRPRSPADVETATWATSSVAKQAAASVPEPGHVLAGRYTVLEQVGQGGMGLVLAAYDSRLDRRVALKLLRSRSTDGGTEGEARLVREAQAMARLSHPHVVAVYDAGSLEDGSVFIAMEFVEGQTLRAWATAQPRTWREVLAAYLDAGQGLAAAHAAGLVHRDFKPDNVLVGRDGRVRVTDFGLARAGNAAPEPTPAPPVDRAASGSGSSWGSGSLTQPGMLMGTRDYMAPELLEGGPADVRSDLYAFCVALYEALHGQLPFTASSLFGMLKVQRAGPPVPPARSEVPAWVTRALLQGLKPDAMERPASVEALLTALRDDPDVRRQAWRKRVALGAVGVALGGLAAVAVLQQGERAPVCGHEEARLAGTWDAAMRERVQASLLSTGLPYAPATAERVGTALDGYAHRWVELSRETCEAGQGPAAAPGRLVVLRESCLERRRSRLRATTELLAQGADRELLGKAVQAVRALPPLEDCADTRALTAAVPPPEDPVTRAKVDALQQQVDRVEALYEAGRYKEGLVRDEALLREVEPVGHAPLLARVLFLGAKLRDGTGDFKGAEEQARKALDAAARGRDLVLMSQALSQQVFTVGKREGRHPEALLLAPAVEALAEASGDDLARADALKTLGAVLTDVGRYDEARARHEQALALRQKVLGPEHPELAEALTYLGVVSWWMGKNEEALALFERALALRQTVLGPEHPDVIRSLVNRGAVLRDMGRFEEALETLERVVALQAKVLGPEHPSVATSLGNLSLVLTDLGRPEEGLERAERALALRQKLLGPAHPDVANALINLATVLTELGRIDEALDRAVQARAVAERTLGPEHALVTNALALEGGALVKLKRYAEARERLERALSLSVKTRGPKDPDLVLTLLGLGELALARGKPADAVPPLRRALELAPEVERARVQLRLAEALWDAERQERPSAVALATEARAYWQRLKHRKGLAEASQWLVAHADP